MGTPISANLRNTGVSANADDLAPAILGVGRDRLSERSARMAGE